MKSILFKIFKFTFNKQILEEISSSTQTFKFNHLEKLKDQKNKCKYLELSMFIDKPIIAISNEWANPVIGIGKEIIYISKANTPVLVIHDYLTNEDKMIFSEVFYFTEQRFNAFSKLDPFEICSIIYKNSTTHQPFEKNKSGVFEGYDVIKEKLINSGFYNEIKKNNFN